MTEPTHYFVQIPAAALDRLAYDVTFGWKVREAVRSMRSTGWRYGAPVQIGTFDPIQANVSTADISNQVLALNWGPLGFVCTLSAAAAPTTVRFFEKPPLMLLPGDEFTGKYTMTDATDL